MAGLSTFGEELILTTLLTGANISLHTADPGNTGADEVVGFAYTREAYGAFSFTGGNPTEAANDAAIEYPTATGSWGTVTHFGIWQGSDFIGGKELVVPKTITTDDIFRFPIGNLTVTTDDI